MSRPGNGRNHPSATLRYNKPFVKDTIFFVSRGNRSQSVIEKCGFHLTGLCAHIFYVIAFRSEN